MVSEMICRIWHLIKKKIYHRMAQIICYTDRYDSWNLLVKALPTLNNIDISSNRSINNFISIINDRGRLGTRLLIRRIIKNNEMQMEIYEEAFKTLQ